MDFTINAKPNKRYIPSDKTSFKYKIWSFVNSAGFEYFILFLITVNTIILMMKVIIYDLSFEKTKIMNFLLF